MPKKRRAIVIFDRALTYQAAIAGAIIVFVMLLIIAEIILRNLFNIAILWMLQVSEATIAFITFLGAGWVLRGEGHVKVDLVVTRLTPRHQDLLNLVTSTICIIICAIITVYGVRSTWHQYLSGFYIPALITIPEFAFNWIIPVGTFFLTIQFVRRTLRLYKKWRGIMVEEEKGEFMSF